METMGVSTSFWSGRRVLVTGHTGYKGAWLSLWLSNLGASVYGYSLPPVTKPNLYSEINLPDTMAGEFIGNVRDQQILQKAIESSAPQLVFHLASQTLVRKSYKEPVNTFLTNIGGTVNLLHLICKYCVKTPIVVITSDKCYRNNDEGYPFIETDSLGGGDPYSASKACQDLVTEAMSIGIFGQTARISTARSGNVFGGGDWAEDRLVPDIMRSALSNKPLKLRHPQSVRPWLYVLDPIHGYIRLAEWLSTKSSETFSSFNFGPSNESMITVEELVERFSSEIGNRVVINNQTTPEKEAGVLRLNSNKASRVLGWSPRIELSHAISETTEWYKRASEGQYAQELCISAINRYQEFLTKDETFS